MGGATPAGQSKVQCSAHKLDRAQELFRQAYVAEQVQDDALNEKQLAEAELQAARDN
jgi:multidrug resistance efflux pump